MKKNLLLILAVVLSLGVFGQAKNKQGIHTELAKNPAFRSIDALATDFTATDLDGNVHNLYTYLNAGKTVMIDLFATWCSPCWSYSQNGALEDVYATYGPGGTDEMMVFAIESDATTDTSEIYNSTLGNWTTGINYPMINDDDIAATFNLTYFPYIIMICPNGEWFEAGQGITAYYTAAEYYAMAGNCVGPNDVPVAEFEMSTSTILMNGSIDFTDLSMGIPTSWAWTFTDGTPATSTDQNPTITWSVAGTFDVTLVASNANGASAPVTKQITVLDPSATDNLNVTFEECVMIMEDDFSPYSWTLHDGDGSNVWTDLGLSGPHSWTVYDHPTVGQSLAPHGGDKCAICMNAITAGAPNDDWLISPQIELGGNSSITLWAASLSVQWGAEEFYVEVSTTDNLPASFSPVGPKHEPGETWEEIVVDLSAYDGQSVYIAIHCVSNDHFVLYVDDIVISSSIGITEQTEKAISIYPNPSTGMVNINNVAGAKVVVYNVIGEQVVSIENANQMNTIDFSEFGVGTYYVKVVTETETTTHTLSITR